MEGCPKVKNPCKICLLGVTNKNGLQCQGACKKWAHFTCLHYTPGRIQDIKSGVITVTCPCPDCVSEEPKEFLTNPPFTCTNNQCPANKQAICPEDDCPTNRLAHMGAMIPVSSSSCPGTPDDDTPPPSSIRLPTGPRTPPCGSPKPAPCPPPPCPPPPCPPPKQARPARLPVVPCGPTPPCVKSKMPKVSPMKPPPCPLLTPCPSRDGKKAIRPQPCSCRSPRPRELKIKLLFCILFIRPDKGCRNTLDAGPSTSRSGNLWGRPMFNSGRVAVDNDDILRSLIGYMDSPRRQESECDWVCVDWPLKPRV